MNVPADIVSVDIADGPADDVLVTVDVANYRTLPPNSSFSVWFDVDGSTGTGNGEGREARVRYASTGVVGLELWSGTRLIAQPPTGISGSFADGRAVISVRRATLGLGPRFGVYVVSERGQPAGTGEFVASDAAPDSGNYAFSGAGSARFSDRAGDHQSAPDIASVRVSDSEDGWVDFVISLPNANVLPRAPVIGISIDADDDLATGDSGADVGITAVGSNVVVDRWSDRGRTWVPDVDEPRVRGGSSGITVTVGIHRGELGVGSRIGFAALAAGLTATDAFTGVDVTPDGTRFFRYVLDNKLAVELVLGSVRTSPARPVGGARVTVTTTVRRSDTGAPTGSGSVTCAVKVDRKRVPAIGRPDARPAAWRCRRRLAGSRAR